MVTDSLASLFLLHLPSHPLLLVKISLLSGVIGLTARRFVDGLELYSTTLPVPFVEPVSVFIAAPSVDAKPLSRNAQIHLFVGTSFGGLYARTLSNKELLCGFISDDDDERQASIVLIAVTFNWCFISGPWVGFLHSSRNLHHVLS